MNKNTANILMQLTKAVIDESEQNAEFAKKLEQILTGNSAPLKKRPSKIELGTARPTNRRDPAVFDPIALFIEDEELLSEKLHELTDKQLKDIIADYGMDPDKLAMKWKDRERLIDRIIDVSRRRASKGDAFRM